MFLQQSHIAYVELMGKKYFINERNIKIMYSGWMDILKGKKKLSGFTLIELSIVLVIISLIVGGIVGGKALIDAAEIQNIIRKSNEYKVAINAFELQYDYLPGDLPTMNEYFPSCIGYTGNPCNGNGNRQIHNVSIHLSDENLRFWQALSLSEILPHSYSGHRLSNGGTFFVIDWNLPGVDYFEGKANWWAGYSSYYGKSGNRLRISNLLTFTGGDRGNGGPLMTPKIAKRIDIKADDGQASKGMVVGTSGDVWYFTGCVDGNNDWLLSSESDQCILHWWLN